MRVVRAFQLSESRIGKWKAEKHYLKSVVIIYRVLYREVYSKRTFEIRTRLKLDKGTKAWKV